MCLIIVKSISYSPSDISLIIWNSCCPYFCYFLLLFTFIPCLILLCVFGNFWRLVHIGLLFVSFFSSFCLGCQSIILRVILIVFCRNKMHIIGSITLLILISQIVNSRATHVCWLEKCTLNCELSFIGGKMRTAAWDTALCIVLGNCSK